MIYQLRVKIRIGLVQLFRFKQNFFFAKQNNSVLFLRKKRTIAQQSSLVRRLTKKTLPLPKEKKTRLHENRLSIERLQFRWILDPGLKLLIVVLGPKTSSNGLEAFFLVLLVILIGIKEILFAVVVIVASNNEGIWWAIQSPLVTPTAYKCMIRRLLWSRFHGGDESPTWPSPKTKQGSQY